MAAIDGGGPRHFVHNSVHVQEQYIYALLSGASLTIRLGPFDAWQQAWEQQLRSAVKPTFRALAKQTCMGNETVVGNAVKLKTQTRNPVYHINWQIYACNATDFFVYVSFEYCPVTVCIE
jgi:hypothetical protein